MGNSNRRSSTTNRNLNSTNNNSNTATVNSHSSISRPITDRITRLMTNEWSDNNIQRLISEQHLAPKTIATESSRNCVECPICFLEYQGLNTSNCCKQHICTDCYIQLRTSPAPPSSSSQLCPFCGSTTLHVTYEVIATDAIVESESKSGRKNQSISSSALEEEGKEYYRDVRDNSSERCASQLACDSSRSSYTTPEQERKLRSLSMDDTHRSSDGSSRDVPTPVVATKSDRDTLEKQIREQRRQFCEDDYFGTPSRQVPSHSRSYQGRNYRTYGRRRRSSDNYSLRDSSFDNSSNNSFSMSQLEEEEEHRVGNNSDSDESNEFRRQYRNHYLDSNDENSQMINAIQSLLTSHEQRITSVEELEQIMLLEAIRQSMEDQEQVEQQAAESGSTVVEETEISVSVEDNNPIISDQATVSYSDTPNVLTDDNNIKVSAADNASTEYYDKDFDHNERQVSDDMEKLELALEMSLNNDNNRFVDHNDNSADHNSSNKDNNNTTVNYNDDIQI